MWDVLSRRQVRRQPEMGGAARAFAALCFIQMRAARPGETVPSDRSARSI